MENIEKIAEMEAMEMSEEELEKVDGGYVQYKRPPERVGFIIYQIGRGDTLNKIARYFGVTVNEILAWNPYIENRNRIYSGAYLYIRAYMNQ